MWQPGRCALHHPALVTQGRWTHGSFIYERGLQPHPALHWVSRVLHGPRVTCQGVAHNRVEHGWTSWLNLGWAGHVQAEERRAELLHLWDVTLPVCCQQPNVTPTSTPPDVVRRQETTLTEAVEYHTECRFCHSSSQPLRTTERQPAAARGRQVLDTLEHWQLDEVRKKCLGGTREPHCNWFTQSKWTIKSLDGAELECKN